MIHDPLCPLHKPYCDDCGCICEALYVRDAAVRADEREQAAQRVEALQWHEFACTFFYPNEIECDCIQRDFIAAVRGEA